MDPSDFKAPFISQEEIWQAADDFRAKYWPAGKLPVNIEAIVEFELDLEIRPIYELGDFALIGLGGY